MKKYPRFISVLRAGLLALAFTPLAGQTAARLLPFQGRLTDANGQAIADGARVVQFKVYDAPVGGRAVWNGEVHKLSVNDGLVSTVLGSKSDLGSVDFNRQVYLEITVDANADGLVTPADPPLLPRQSILPAVFSAESADSRLLGGYGWSALFGPSNPADGVLLETKIGDGSLNTPKLRDGAVTSAKLANGAVTRGKLDVSGAAAGQALTYNGTEVVWSQVDAANAQTATFAANAGKLNNFDWATLFSGGDPQAGNMSVAGFTSRGFADVNGNFTGRGRALFNGPSLSVLGQLIAPNVGINMFLTDWTLYLRANGDFNHFLRYANGYGGQSGFDGPVLVGVGGGVLGAGGSWSLRWNSSGSVQTRGTVSSGSDRNIKENFESVDPGEVLDKVAALPITRWNYKAEPGVVHVGPVSQDFRAAFGLGLDDKSIAVVDADGVALAAIKGLNQKVDQNHEALSALIAEQRELIQQLKSEINDLKQRP